MASNAAKECGICQDEYSEGQNCPRILPCYDTLCSNCIDQLIATNNKSCPFCRKTFSATSAKDFRINTIVLDLLTFFAATGTNTISSNKGRTTSYPVWKKDFKKETSAKNLADCQKAKAEIQSAIETNLELKTEILQANKTIRVEIFKVLKEIEKKNGKIIKDLEKENGRLNAKLDVIVAKESSVQITDSKLEAAGNFADAAPIIDETEDITNKLETLLKDLKIYLSGDEIKRQSIRKDIDKTKRKISIIQDVLTPTEEDDHDGDAVSSLPGRVAMATEEDTTQAISVDDLRRMVRNGRVLGFQDLPGRGRRYARITINQEDELLCLHHLKEEEEESIPSDVRLIKFDDVMSLVDVSCRRTFLELGVGGGGGGGGGERRSLGRIVIRLFHNENFPRNFSILCTGEMGPSYANSNILQVICKGHNKCENVVLGDYENNDGRGGKAMVAGVNWRREWGREIYKREWVKGLVTGLWGSINGADASQFQIIIRDNPGGQLNGSFGIIESGLNVLTEAIKNHPNIRDVNILDCGIVLSR